MNDRYFEELTQILDKCSPKYGCSKCPIHSRCVVVWDRISTFIGNRTIKKPEFEKHRFRLIETQRGRFK